MRLKIRHNMEVAHRLSKDTTKCKQIHGHGMQIELVFLNLEEGENGMAHTRFGQTIEFGSAKRKFRDYIDGTYDHHLLLNQEDPWAGPIFSIKDIEINPETQIGTVALEEQQWLPGLTIVTDEPTVENLAKWIAEWAAQAFQCDVAVRLDETKTNGAEVMVTWSGTITKVQR
jgi:6-pyruvoyl-tetrahydropterin synthase